MTLLDDLLREKLMEQRTKDRLIADLGPERGEAEFERIKLDRDAMLARETRCPCPGVMRAGCPCSRCHGHGWYTETIEGTENDPVPDYRERYCDCEDGKKLSERER